MSRPRIIDASPGRNSRARLLVRAVLNKAVVDAARELHDQPLSIKALMARLLIEDFAELSLGATNDWLEANADENFALRLQPGLTRDEQIGMARRMRGDAFRRLAETEIEWGARPGK